MARNTGEDSAIVALIVRALFSAKVVINSRKSKNKTNIGDKTTKWHGVNYRFVKV
jgi:hypothetical protein